MGMVGIRKWKRALLALCTVLCALADFAAPALAAHASFPAGSTCHASAARGERYAAIASDARRWNCAPADWSVAADRSFLRFDLRRQSGEAPTRFITRLTRFDRMTLTVIGRDGSSASRVLLPADLTPATDDWSMSAALPAAASPPVAVIARIEQPRYVAMLSDARLGSAADAARNGAGFELLIAALCGMLCLPMIYNFAFYKILRERFLLWHAAAVGFMLVQTLVTSGLVNRLFTISLTQLCVLSAVSFAGGVAAALLFAADLCEQGTLDSGHRRALRLAALWIAPWTLIYLFADGGMRPVAPMLYYLSWIPVMATMVWVMAVAKLRGSRSVNFQIAAWTPLLLTGVIRVATALGLTEAPLEMQGEQHVAIAIEVIVTALGVADRFLVIKRQRDSAWTRARMLEDRVERDPLTGLLNRHAIEHRFEALHAQGFRTIALLDLDRFKDINDNFGHAVGDMVLRAVGEALAPDERTIAIRLGGEEFMLLIAGPDSAEQAERRRQSVALRIAADVPGLDRLVTSSMGLVEYGPRVRVQPDFATAYAHCDRLLYDAKRAGRNRAMKERVQGFAAAVPALAG